MNTRLDVITDLTNKPIFDKISSEQRAAKTTVKMSLRPSPNKRERDRQN